MIESLVCFLSDEVDDEAAVGTAAGGAMKVGLPIGWKGEVGRPKG